MEELFYYNILLELSQFALDILPRPPLILKNLVVSQILFTSLLLSKYSNVLGKTNFRLFAFLHFPKHYK